MKRWRDREDSLELDLTPMLDVVFILLIFFIITASFTENRSIQLERPTSSTAEKQDKRDSFSLYVTADSRYILNGEDIQLSSIHLYAKSFYLKNSDGSAIIHIDSTVSTGGLVDIMDEIRKGGIKEIAISTESGA